MTDEFIPITPVVDDQPVLGFRLPSHFQGVVALMEKDRVFVADVRGRDGIPFIDDIAEGRIALRDEEASTYAEDLGYALSEVLVARGFPKKDIVIALPNSLFSMDILTLPAVGGKHLESLIHRKILRSNVEAGENEAWCYEILEEKKTDPEGGVRVLIARTPASWLLKFHSVLKKYGIRPERITVSLAGVIQLMKVMESEKEGESVLAIEVSSGDAVLSIFMNKHLHQIRLLKDGVNADRERFNYILQVELQRTQAFHKGKFKGKSIKRALVLGSHAGCVDMDKATLPLDVVRTKFQSASGDELTEKESQTEEGLLCLMTGLLLATGKNARRGGQASEMSLDFTPSRRRTASIAAALVIFVVIALAGVIALSSRLERDNELLSLRLDWLEEEVLPKDCLEEHRDRFRDWDEYSQALDVLYYDMKSDRRNVAESFLAVKEHLPPRSVLRSIQYIEGSEGGEGTWCADRIQFQIEGDFTGTGSRNLMDSIRSLKASDLFRDIRFEMGGQSRSPTFRERMVELADVELILR